MDTDSTLATTNPETTSIWRKTPEELNVAESLKITGIVMAASVAASAALVGLMWAPAYVSDFRSNRRIKKAVKAMEADEKAKQESEA